MSGLHDPSILGDVLNKAPPVQFNPVTYTQQRPRESWIGPRKVDLPPTSAQPTRSSLKQPVAAANAPFV